MSGLIGGILRDKLAGRYNLRALNRSEVAGVDCHQADIVDFEAIQPAFEGIDVVVHLAAFAKLDEDFEKNLQTNIIGTYNVFESARRAGVRRIVFASSGAVVTGWESTPPYDAVTSGRYEDVPDNWQPVTHESAPRPVAIYGCSKLWGEALARHYSDAHGMSMCCLRIGRVNPENRPLEPRHWSVWCSHRDVAQIIEKCISAPPSLKYDLFYAVSNNKWSYRDIDHAREILGYTPEDSADDFEMKRS